MRRHQVKGLFANRGGQVFRKVCPVQCDSLTVTASGLQRLEHGATAVDRIHMAKWRGPQQLCRKTTVAIAQHQRALSRCHFAEKAEPATFERSAKAEVLHPPVGFASRSKPRVIVSARR